MWWTFKYRIAQLWDYKELINTKYFSLWISDPLNFILGLEIGNGFILIGLLWLQIDIKW